jgi:hypothetical protein
MFAEHGHLSVEWGRQGRGHPNKYRLLLKPQQGAVSSGSRKPHQPAVLKSQKTPHAEKSKPHFDDPITAPACHEPLQNHLKNHMSAPTARNSARVERGAVTETETTSLDAPLNPAFTTADAAAISEPLIPVPRAPEGARIQPAEQDQPSSCRASPEMGPAAIAHGQACREAKDRRRVAAETAKCANAGPAFAAVYERGRQVLGADKADILVGGLFDAYGDDTEGMLDALACAEDEFDPCQYIEQDIKLALNGNHRDDSEASP